MNGIPRVCVAALLVAMMASAAAGTQAQDAPPASPPEAGKSTEQADADNPPATRLREEIDQAVDAIRGYSAERRDEAAASARRAADDLDRQMARLQERTDQRWARMNQAARSRSQATMADLRKRRNAMAEWYGGIRHSSTAAWSEVRSGFVTSYHELADALRKARAEFEQDEKDGAAPRDDAPGSPP